MRCGEYEITLPLIGGNGKPIEGETLLVSGLYGTADIVRTAELSELLRRISTLRAKDIADKGGLCARLYARGHLTEAGANASHHAPAPALAHPCASVEKAGGGLRKMFPVPWRAVCRWRSA